MKAKVWYTFLATISEVFNHAVLVENKKISGAAAEAKNIGKAECRRILRALR